MCIDPIAFAFVTVTIIKFCSFCFFFPLSLLSTLLLMGPCFFFFFYLVSFAFWSVSSLKQQQIPLSDNL